MNLVSQILLWNGSCLLACRKICQSMQWTSLARSWPRSTHTSPIVSLCSSSYMVWRWKLVSLRLFHRILQGSPYSNPRYGVRLLVEQWFQNCFAIASIITFIRAHWSSSSQVLCLSWCPSIHFHVIVMGSSFRRVWMIWIKSKSEWLVIVVVSDALRRVLAPSSPMVTPPFGRRFMLWRSLRMVSPPMMPASSARWAVWNSCLLGTTFTPRKIIRKCT